VRSGRLLDRAGVALCWAAGLSLFAITGFIVIWLSIKGLSAISWSFLTSDPKPNPSTNSLAGGIVAPLVGSIVIVSLGTLIALPLGLGSAVFLTEYRRPIWLARIVETSIEVVFGVPSIVFALFGVIAFTNPNLIFLSSKVNSSGQAYGKSFLTASVIMAMLALPPIARSSQEAIASVSQIQREASYALGKGKLATIRRVVMPQARAGIATGIVLGMGRIAGDTAIIWLMLGGTPSMGSGNNWWYPSHWLDTLRNTGSTLTSYTYGSSPVGDYNAPGKAYGAAFLLILLIIAMNAAVISISNRAGRRLEGKGAR
jgi:phosphate transport system permease protein